MPVDPKLVQSIFLAAVEHQNPADRAVILDRECGTDTALRERVESLLHANDRPDSFLLGIGPEQVIAHLETLLFQAMAVARPSVLGSPLQKTTGEAGVENRYSQRIESASIADESLLVASQTDSAKPEASRTTEFAQSVDFAQLSGYRFWHRMYDKIKGMSHQWEKYFVMNDQMFDSFRKAAESSLHMQQEMFKQWTQQWPSMPLNAAGVSAEWFQTFQKRWIEFTTDSLTKHRESLDSMYKSGIQLIEQSCRLSEAKNPEEYRRVVEEVCRKVFAVCKDQSEAQLREFQKGTEKWFEMASKTTV
jgi:hypothetical protein